MDPVTESIVYQVRALSPLLRLALDDEEVQAELLHHPDLSGEDRQLFSRFWESLQVD
jgi:hypothetical protein